MRIYKIKAFKKWATKEGISDQQLIAAVTEIRQGLVDAYLGGHVFKKRIAFAGQGKRGGARILLAYQADNKVFFIYGYAKNRQGNIRKEELIALKHYAKQLLAYTDIELDKAMGAGELVAVLAKTTKI